MRRVASAQVRAARQQYRFRHTAKAAEVDSKGKLIAPSLKKNSMTDRKDSAGARKNSASRTSSKVTSGRAASPSPAPSPRPSPMPSPKPPPKNEMKNLAEEQSPPPEDDDAAEKETKPNKSHIKVARQKTDPAIKKKISFRESHERSASLRVRPIKTTNSPSPSPSSLGSESSLGDEEALMRSEVSASGHRVDISPRRRDCSRRTRVIAFNAPYCADGSDRPTLTSSRQLADDRVMNAQNRPRSFERGEQ